MMPTQTEQYIMTLSSVANAVIEARPYVGKEPLTDALLKHIMYWDPPVPAWVPLKKTKNSSLRFGCIAEEHLSSALAFEGEMITLTPDNWKHALQYCKLDFILVESFWATSSGHWYMGLFKESSCHDELLKLLAFARKQAVPTVFWMTRGHEYHHLYKHGARYFDLVCCADRAEIPLLAEENIQAHLLLPCVQPALYNPFKHFKYANRLSINILFDGWADIDRANDNFAALDGICDLGLSVIESRFEIYHNRIKNTPKFAKYILGCATQNGKITALKYADACITSDTTISTKTTQQWMALEAASSRTAVVHSGILPDNDIRHGFVVACQEYQECNIECIRYEKDPLYRERVAHLAWRHVNMHHTTAHRMRELCALLGIAHSWKEFPKASFITPTFREHQLKHCLRTFEQSAYPNKELILVFNGDRLPTHADLGLDSPRNDLIIAQVPGDTFTGAAMNLGNLYASGDYYFKIDDDDYYGPNYILDMILHARSIDAEFFSKPRAPYEFVGDKRIYVDKKIMPLTILESKSLYEQKPYLGGNTMSGTSDFFCMNNYHETSYGAADTMFQMNVKKDVTIAQMDIFNAIATRENNISGHTAKHDNERLKSGRRILSDINELIL